MFSADCHRNRPCNLRWTRIDKKLQQCRSHSVEVIGRQMGRLSDETRAKILGESMVKMFRLGGAKLLARRSLAPAVIHLA